jgi:hypothetical protein
MNILSLPRRVSAARHGTAKQQRSKPTGSPSCRYDIINFNIRAISAAVIHRSVIDIMRYKLIIQNKYRSMIYY